MRDKLGTIEKAMLALTSRLGYPMSHRDLHAVFHGGQAAFGIKDAIKAAEHMGFQVSSASNALESIDPVIFPIIGFDAAQNAYLVLNRNDAGYEIQPFGDEEEITRIPDEDAHSFFEDFFLHLKPTDALKSERTQDTAKASVHWFWSAFAGHKWTYIQIILAAIIANFLGLSTSLFTMVVYDRVLPNEAMESLFALTMGIGIALVFDLIIKSIRASFIDSAGKVADQKMAQKVFDQVLSLRLSAQSGSTGGVASTLREFETLRDFFTSATLVALVDLPFVLFFIFVIWMIGGPLALIPSIAVPIVLIAGVAVHPLLARLAKANSQDGRSKQSILVETLGGLETIKAVGASPMMRHRWQNAVSDQANHASKARALTQFALNVTALTQQAAQVLIIFYGVFLIRDGVVSMGALIACVILTGRTLAPLAQIAQILTRITGAQSAYTQIDALMNAPSERPTGDHWLARPELGGGIELQDVSFQYPDTENVTLNQINLKINAGEKVAFMGPVGSGKSTLSRLILGLYHANSGKVLIDGTEIRAIDPGDLRQNMGFALQDVWLFSGSVKENITVGKPHIEDAHILEKARIACVDDFISQHPHGYDLKIRERGQGLSGGQRQCISLARALINDPGILILDEPSSSMDVKTEERVINNLQDEIKDRTLIVVTHRPSLLKLVDRVVVVENGRITFDGPKEALLKGRGAQK